MTDLARLRQLAPPEARETLGDGSFGGFYQRPDDELAALWAVAVEETRDQMESGW
jgi:creatinine amidohydrolase